MFNSPVLDVAIGLVFIFLLYSLLATSIKEAIATLFSLRASMLKKAIVENMLANTPPDVKWLSIAKGILKLLKSIIYLMGFFPKKKEEKKKLGDKFYDHALIKNYGATRIFPLPSYIPTDNFSTVLIDVLKKDFEDQAGRIAALKLSNPKEVLGLEEITKNLHNSNTVTKIKELLDYYWGYYLSLDDTKPTGNNTEAMMYYLNYPKKVENEKPPGGIIDRDTCKILRMHLQNSGYDIDTYTKKLEDWFNDTMDRVTGWYKRQVQTILFIIGLLMAVTFNVDTLQIADKLTTDKDAREKLIAMAEKAADEYKDDPRVQQIKNKLSDPKLDSAQQQAEKDKFDNLKKEYKKNEDEAKKMIDGDIKDANNLLALGWGDFNKSSDSSRTIAKYWGEFYAIRTAFLADTAAAKAYAFSRLGKPNNASDSVAAKKYNDRFDSIAAAYKTDTAMATNAALAELYNNRHWVKLKVGYVLQQTFTGKKFLGFLILAFAVCLGSPFWFDLLNKLIRIRGAGKKEDSSTQVAQKDAAVQLPLTVNVNTQTTGEEAVG